MHTAATFDDLTFLNSASPSSPAELTAGDEGEAVAVALMRATDGEVATSGIPGTHPVIAEAAERCVAAHQRGDFAEAVRACREIRAFLRSRRPRL